MSTDPRPLRSPWAVLRALVTPLALAGALVCAPVAAADTDSAEETPESGGTRAEAIAEGLSASPVHVDPVYEDAFSTEARERVIGLIEEGDLDLYVIVVPLVEGDAWNGETSSLAAAVHDRMGGGERHYLLYDRRGDMDGQDLGVASDDWSKPAFHGALAARYESMGGQQLIPTQVEAAVEAALSEDPEAAYEAAMEAYHDRSGTSPPSAASPVGAPIPVILGAVAAVVLVALAILLFRFRARGGSRSTAGARRRPTPVAQHAAFDNAERARLESIVEHGERDLIELGERLQADGAAEPQHLSRALDARDAAARVHDRMIAAGPTLPDAVGVLVLLDRAEDALAGRRTPRRHCYANPLHGTGTRQVRWREFGGSRTIRVPLCAECARAVRDRVRPTVLPAERDGGTVPYYEVPADESVWSATGYGTLRDDLVDRILRGDHSGRR
ncbi:hypothetical protein [Nocardiopsis sp. MG754419]|uniref:hypothetical protein n=1 Tax=Nocardiopsis sp. MG754419 TaxID=2259865 RepID=UPI001BA80E08|nr:hypothetical protein [Nocardiopsis sp. MG754419]MBR8741749.1 hypothetical protein [Nocardiopsis sp. MG754419]